MENKRPLPITLFALWAGIMGVFIALDGWSYFLQGIDVGDAPEFWIQDLRRYIFPGILWIFGGVGFIASALGTWSAREWGRLAGLYSGAAIVAGWLIIKIISLGFGNPAPFLSLLVGIPALYLLTQEARDYYRD